MNPSISIIYYTSKTLKNGNHPLMLRIIQNRQTKYVSLGVNINPNFWDFKRLNTALLLLNFDGTNDSARQYYRRLKQLGYGRWNTLYAVLLKLPYSMFGYLLGPLYVWYKRRVTV